MNFERCKKKVMFIISITFLFSYIIWEKKVYAKKTQPEKKVYKLVEEAKKLYKDYICSNKKETENDKINVMIKYCKKALEIDFNYADAHYNLGVAYAVKGLWDEAIEGFKEAIRSKPDYALAHYNLGVAYAVKGLWDEAIEGFKEAIRIDPDNIKAHCGLGSLYYKKGNKKKALKEYEILKNLDKEKADNLFKLINDE